MAINPWDALDFIALGIAIDAWRASRRARRNAIKAALRADEAVRWADAVIRASVAIAPDEGR